MTEKTDFLIRGKPSTISEIESAFETKESASFDTITRVVAESKRQLFLYISELENVEGKSADIDWIRLYEEGQDWLNDYQKVVFDTISEETWVCDAHGELKLENISVSVGGMLMCEICSAAKHAQADESIDPSIELKMGE